MLSSLLFRKLLYEICEELTTRDLDTAKFLASKSDISRRKMDAVKTTQDFLLLLEQVQLLTPGKLDLLKEILEVLERNDLLQKVERLESTSSSKWLNKNSIVNLLLSHINKRNKPVYYYTTEVQLGLKRNKMSCVGLHLPKEYACMTF